MRTYCIPIITLLHRSQTGQASHWLSCLPQMSFHQQCLHTDDSPSSNNQTIVTIKSAIK